MKVSIAGSLRDREVACSASDRQGSNFESCVWRTVSSQSSHHPREVLLVQFTLYVHKGGLKPDSFYFIVTSRQILPFGFAKRHELSTQQTRNIHAMSAKCWDTVCNADPTSVVRWDMPTHFIGGEGSGAMVKASFLESQRSRVRTPLWHSSFKETKCFFPAHS